MIGKQTECYRQASQYLLELTEGIVMSVDPSIGSTSSMPGWAVYRAGELIASGTLSIPPNKAIWERLRRLANEIRKLYKKYSPDILVYEEIPAQRYGRGGNAAAHSSLLKAVGTILSVPGTTGCVGIHPFSWKKHVRPTYLKGDREDAEEIGWIVIQLARRIKEIEGNSTKRRRKT